MLQTQFTEAYVSALVRPKHLLIWLRSDINIEPLPISRLIPR